MKIDVKHGTIGPKHDPYGCSTVTVTLPDGKSAEFYEDGLGARWTALYRADGMVHSEWRWYDSKEEEKEELAATTAFQQWVGIDPEAAREQWESTWEPDPYGPLSRYI